MANDVQVERGITGLVHAVRSKDGGALDLDKPVNIGEIKELLLSDKAVLIPAGEGREPVRILPRPGYIKMEHGFSMMDVDENWKTTTSKSTPVYYAIYLFGIGNDAKDIRTLRLPVQLKGVLRNEEDSMVDEMVAQGFDEQEVRRFCDSDKSQRVVGNIHGNILLSLRMALKLQNFVTSTIHQELTDYGEKGRIQSGWRADGKPNLFAFVAISQPWPDTVWHACISPEDRIVGTDEEVVSPITLDQGAINSAGPELNQLLKRIIKANK